MTPDQQRALLDTYGPDWQTADLLWSDEGLDAARRSQLSGSTRTDAGLFFQTKLKGIYTFRFEVTLRDDDVRARQGRVIEERLAVPWAAVRAHRATLPDSVLERLRDARNAWATHNRAYPTPYPDLEVRRVGPSGDLHPEDRALYAERMDRYQVETVQPWHERNRELDGELADAIRRCLPLATDEPADLLEMLAAVDTGLSPTPTTPDKSHGAGL